MPADDAQRLLIDSIRRGDADAWQELIDRYEGRLLAFVDSRLQDRAASEDVVQETFTGFLVSLPHYDERTPLETYLFSIAAHKLTDTLRKSGRRPALPLKGAESKSGDAEPAGAARRASSLVRSGERRDGEERVVGDCLASLIERWKERGEWERLKCAELLFVRGRPNKEVAAELGISEQAVANHKQYVLSHLKKAAAN